MDPDSNNLHGRREGGQWVLRNACSGLLGIFTPLKRESTQELGRGKISIKEKNNCYFESVAEPIEVIAIKHFYF